jgi:membrane-bound lytic murein transglycosylase A
MKAFVSSCPLFEKLSPVAKVHTDTIFGQAKIWQRACQQARRQRPQDARNFFEAEFLAFKQAPSNKDGLLTGYFVPTLDASKKRTNEYTVPLYPNPNDILTINLGAFDNELQGKTIWGRVNDRGRVVPYYTRAEIDNEALKHITPLAWLRDPIAAFFLHIQGSGVLSFPDGTQSVYGFAGRNGHPYTPIGRVLVNEGYLPADGVSMQAIKEWLYAHPEKAARIMQANASYIFFAEKSEGVTGAAGISLTPKRSVAIDPSVMPYGGLLWMAAAPHPVFPHALHGMVVAHDTGAAIRGAARADLYLGVGPAAGDAAGRIQNQTDFYILVPKP